MTKIAPMCKCGHRHPWVVTIDGKPIYTHVQYCQDYRCTHFKKEGQND